MPSSGSFSPVFDSNRRGGKAWYVGIPKRLSSTGKYRREFFATKAEAAKRGVQLQALDKESQRAAIVAGPQLIKDAVNYDELFRDLHGFKGGLAEACEAFMVQLDQKHGSVSLGELLDAYEQEGFHEWAEGTRGAWKSLRNHVTELEERPAGSLSIQFWRGWLGDKATACGWKPGTFNKMRRTLSTAYHRGIPDLVKENPMTGVRTRKIPKEKKEVYTIDEIEALLNCAWEHDQELIPFYAIAIFAGLRPDSELKKLRWEDVEFDKGWIRVAADFDNKTETKRFVPIPDNLAAWLEPWRQAKGGICSDLTNFDKRRRYLVRGRYQADEGVPEKEWVDLVPNGAALRDLTRHTFGSYMDVATGHDRDRICEWMGHGDYRTYNQHYRNSRSEGEGKRFLQILPPTAPNPAL